MGLGIKRSPLVQKLEDKDFQKKAISKVESMKPVMKSGGKMAKQAATAIAMKKAGKAPKKANYGKMMKSGGKCKNGC